MKTRTKPRRSDAIRAGLALVKAHARPDMTAIHLLPCDLEKVARKPEKYDVIRQTDGRLVTVFNSTLIDVVSIDD